MMRSVPDASWATDRDTMRSLSWQQATTLMELVIVLAVLMILVLIGAKVWVDQSMRAQREGALTTSNALVKALKIYKAEWGVYPSIESITPLYDYVNATELNRMYDSTTPAWTGASVNGVGIYRSGNAVCIRGTVSDIAPAYRTTLCAETDEAFPDTHKDNLPTCWWEGKHNWRPCQDGL